MQANNPFILSSPHPLPIYCIHPTPIWAPLALGMIFSYIKQHLKTERYIKQPFFAQNETELEALIQEHGEGICLFSNYMWTHPDNLRITQWVKAKYPNVLTVHGGPDSPAYPERCESFLREHPYIDFIVRGEGESTVLELLEHYSSKETLPLNVSGLSFIHSNSQDFIQTHPRPRANDLSEFPSPYLDGTFDNIKHHWMSLTIETNRGCPYACTFCDWGSATFQKIKRFNIERTFQEIEWMGKNQVAEIWIADANFGIFENDVEITKKICEVKQTYGFPKRITVNYAKNTKKYLAEIVSRLTDAGLIGVGIISLQTRDQATLKAVNRTNIKTTEYDKLKAVFQKKKLPLSTQLMIGLPGSSRESFKDDLRYFFYQNIDVQVFRTVILPNSPMAHPDYLKKYQIKFDKKGLILSNATLPAEEIDRMEHLARLYRTTHNFGILRYWLSFLDWDYKIDPIQFLDDLITHLKSLPDSHILSHFYDKDSPAHDLLNSHIPFREYMRSQKKWQAFYQALSEYTLKTYPQVEAAQLSIVSQVQVAVMPEQERAYPLSQNLNHDFKTYFKEQQEGVSKALGTYAPASFEVEDPLNLSETPLPKLFSTKGFPRWIWELYSPLNFRLDKELKILPSFHKVS